MIFRLVTAKAEPVDNFVDNPPRLAVKARGISTFLECAILERRCEALGIKDLDDNPALSKAMPLADPREIALGAIL
jgi:hypothetical protein